MTVREAATQDLTAKANAAAAAAGYGAGFWKRTWLSGVTPQMTPFATVYYAQDAQHGMTETSRELGGQFGPAVENEFLLAFQITFKGDGVTAPDQAVDAYIANVYKAVVGQRNPGVYLRVGYVGTSFIPAQADYPYCRAVLYVRVKTRTKTEDPENWGA